MALLETNHNTFQLESEQAYNPYLRAIGIGVVGSALYAAHRTMLASVPGYAPKLHSWARTFEEKSPHRIARTFGISDHLSSYITPDELRYTVGDLFERDGSLNIVGDTFQRQFTGAGLDFDVRSQVTHDNPLVFRGRRTGGSAYMQLADRAGINFETRFTDAEGRLAGAASRYKSDLEEFATVGSKHENFFLRQWENLQSFRQRQVISNASPWRLGEKELSEKIARGELVESRYRPFHSRSFGGSDPGEEMSRLFRGIRSRAGVGMLGAVEHPQRLFAQAGVGLERGSWNKAFHIPFLGEGGMVNEMLTRRALPIALGVTALGWLDYHLGHPSNKVIDLGLKANVLRADLTDQVPGARGVTDFYERVVPGPQYGPLALPALGAFAGGLLHYSRVLRDKFPDQFARKAGARILPDMQALRKWATEGRKLFSTEGAARIWKSLGTPGKGALAGLAAMLPFVPGMLGSRKSGGELRDIYSGVEPVPVRSGRWWEIGKTPFEGTRIKAWRPHWSVLRKSHAEDISLYGSEKEKWRHNPILHPVRWLRDPYWLERQHYHDRPYPVASPAFSNVPLVGPLLAATIGKLVKPPVRMHEEEWDGSEYSLYSTRLEPKGPDALPAPMPTDEFTLGEALKKEVGISSEYRGLGGFLASSFYRALFPDYDKGKEVFFQGSRQMDSLSRRYYERELGAGMGPAVNDATEPFGYTEPFRRFVQREEFEPQANEIPNQMPSWVPGDDYYMNFRVGDPFTKVDDGYARLPGAGYEALHPELQGVNPEDYPDIHKMAILADVAPYSREYNTYRQKVGAELGDDTRQRIEYEKILNRVRETRDSGIRMDDRRFTAPVEEISGTVKAVSPAGIELEEYPGRRLHFSTVGLSAADLSARILGEHNNLTSEQVAEQVDLRRQDLSQYMSDVLANGTRVRAVVPKGAITGAEDIRAVILAGGDNINAQLIERGLGQYREDLGGGEARAMHGIFGRSMGELAETVSYNMPSPAHTKLWQERTPLDQYIQSEVYGTRMGRWERPVHDFLMPYLRGAEYRMTGHVAVPSDVQLRRDLSTLSDMMNYLRGLNGQAQGSYTSKVRRTNIGANLMASPLFVASTLPAREGRYFREFLHETDPDKREKILSVASPEMEKALQTQWAVAQARIAQAEGKDTGPVGEGGRLYDAEDGDQYRQADTRLDYGNWLRSKEIADFFSRTGFTLPEQGSEAYGEALDYQDVQLKIIQQEGYDAHDFNIFDDRAALLWRKPYIDGAVSELTSGDDRSPEQLRRAVEQMMLAAGDQRADVRTTVHAGHSNRTQVRVNVSIDQTDDILQDIRRDPDKYD